MTVILTGSSLPKIQPRLLISGGSSLFLLSLFRDGRVVGRLGTLILRRFPRETDSDPFPFPAHRCSSSAVLKKRRPFRHCSHLHFSSLVPHMILDMGTSPLASVFPRFFF